MSDASFYFLIFCGGGATALIVFGIALSIEAKGQRKHDPHTGPCPTCGFQITEVERQPFAFEYRPPSKDD
jgi:hypothetical protein